MNNTRSFALIALLFTSGFCGISYEVLYARLLGNVLGDQFAVRAAVLLTFLLGIGLGTRFAYRLWPHLWLIEAGIGLYALILAAAAPALDWLVYGPLAGPQMTVPAAAVLLALPAMLIGSTLPLFSGYLSALRPGRTFSLAYAVYNLGAAATALAIEFWLLRQFGLKGAILALASLNGAIALSLRLGFADLREKSPESPAEPGASVPTDIAALALSSFGSAVYQLLLIKLVECLFGPFHETFAFVLAIVLFGIAGGSWAVRRWRLDIQGVIALALLGLIWLLAGYGIIAQGYAALYDRAAADPGPLGPIALKFATLAILGLLPAAAFGATIPALLREERHVARESGHLLFVASLANAGGFIVMAFVLHQWLDYGAIVIATGVAATAALALQARFTPAVAAQAAGLLALLLLARGALWDENLLLVGYDKFRDRERLAEARRDLESAERFRSRQDTFSIIDLDGTPYFYINGYISFPLNSVNEKTVGALSALFSPRTDRALVLGLGSGVTAATVGLLFARTDAVEINPAVVENLGKMRAYNFDIDKLTGVRKIVDDGIHFIRSGHDRYDLILNTVTSPLYFSSSKLYTREFLESIGKRLAKGGIYVTWVDSRVGDRGMDIICKTVAGAFNHVALCAITNSYFILLASESPLAVRDPDRVADNAVLRQYFGGEGLRPDLLPYALMTTRVRDLVGDRAAPVNSVDRPELEFAMARLRERGTPQFRLRLMANLTYGDIATALEPALKVDRALQRQFLVEYLEDGILVERWEDLSRITR
jgi:predicted membrane-bound spermidine synthase